MKNFISVEPLLIAYLIPIFILRISSQNLALEKSCRVNLAFSDIVCDAMIDKAKYNINCAKEQYLSNFPPETNFTERPTSSTDFLKSVCQAETESQKLGATIRGIISPIESIFGVVIILIAGRWSDKQSRRKPCIILPMCGEFLSYASLFIGAVFMEELPMEFTILGSLIPALFGDFTLIFMGIYSYLTEITTEDDRIFRFGIIAQMIPIVSMVTLPFSGFLYQKLGYVNAYLIGMAINFLGIVYGIFVLRENNPPQVQSDEDAMEPLKIQAKTHFIKELINKDVFTDCFKVATKRRTGNRRKIIILILVMTVFATAPDWGELMNEYFFVRAKLNWEALEESHFAAFGSLITFLGTTVMVTGMSQILKLSDAMLGIISSSCSTVSRVVYIAVTSTLIMYIGKTLDMFSGVIAVITKSIVAAIIETNETARMYSLLGVIENSSRFIFVPIYSIIYRETVSMFPNSYFICSLLLMVFVTSILIFIHLCIKREGICANIATEIELKTMEEIANQETSCRSHRAKIRPYRDEI